MAQNRVRNTQHDWVELGHEGIEGTQTVAPEAVDYWKSLGWFEVADGQAPAAEQPPASAPAEAPAQDAPAVKKAPRAGQES